MTKQKLISNIVKIIKEAEKEIKTMYEESNFDNPIKNNIETSLKMMAYSNIKSEIKKYKREKENEDE